MTGCYEIHIEDNWVSARRPGTWRSVEEYVLFRKQRTAYEFAAALCEGARVLDFGCGSGYGTILLAKRAACVVGVDTDVNVLEYCARKYRQRNLTFQKIAPDFVLPFQDGVFDIAVSFQVIEHISEVTTYLRELKRVLANGGVLLITTPNRRHRLFPFQKPWNPEHYREYEPKGLREELTCCFPSVDIFGIYGDGTFNAVELKRVHRLRLDAAIKGPLRQALKAVMAPTAIAKLKQVKGELARRRENVTKRRRAGGLEDVIWEQYKAGRFYVKEAPCNALDLLAICRAQ